MKEHFEAQINAFADRRTPMTLFYAVGVSVEHINLIDKVAYDGVNEVVLPAGLTFVGMRDSVPVFKRA